MVDVLEEDDLVVLFLAAEDFAVLVCVVFFVVDCLTEASFVCFEVFLAADFFVVEVFFCSVSSALFDDTLDADDVEEAFATFFPFHASRGRYTVSLQLRHQSIIEQKRKNGNLNKRHWVNIYGNLNGFVGLA